MKLMAQFRDKYLADLEGCTILDVGAAIVAGQQQSYRELFERYHYVGMDIEPGPNVDIVGYEGLADAYDVVISGQAMEHVPRPWEWLTNLAQFYRRYICIIAPAMWPEHRFPLDTYRYYPDGMRALFEYADIVPLEVRRAGFDTIGIGGRIEGQQPERSANASA
jgi:hypothetical protein